MQAFAYNDVLPRKTLLQRYAPHLSTEKPSVCFYSAARAGNEPEFTRCAENLSALCEQNKWRAVSGGWSNGLMGCTIKHCSDKICFRTQFFANGLSKTGINEGTYNDALTFNAADFFERKAGMDIASDATFVLPGGFGSLDEGFEAVVFGANKKKPVVLLNVNGYWDGVKAYFDRIDRANLLPTAYRDNIYFATNESEAAQHVKTVFARNTSNAQQKPYNPFSLRRTLENKDFFLHFCEKINDFAGNRPRIGVFASGNIGGEDGKFPGFSARNTLGQQAKVLGEEMGRAGACAVIVGAPSGLRSTFFAPHKRQQNSKTIWLVRDPDAKTLSFTYPAARTLILSVPRHYEVDRLTSLLCQSYVGLAGGLHTADRVFGHAVREQTGHGAFLDIYPETYDPDANVPRKPIFLCDPKLGDGATLWAPLRKQIAHCVNKELIPATDAGLLAFQDDARGLAKKACAAAQLQPGFLVPPPVPSTIFPVAACG